MIQGLSPEQKSLHNPETQQNYLEAADLLTVNENPLLLPREKIFIKGLLRGCSIFPSSEPSKAHIKGISPESLHILQEMVTREEGRKSPHQLLETMNPSYRGPVAETGKSHIPDLLDSMKLYFLGLTGNLDGVIKRVAKKEGNCLEYSLVMQLVLKTYYPKEVPNAQLLAFSSYDKSRHYYLFHKIVVDELDIHFLTLFKGHTRWRSRADAERNIIDGKAEKKSDTSAIYSAFVTLIDQSPNTKVDSD